MTKHKTEEDSTYSNLFLSFYSKVSNVRSIYINLKDNRVYLCILTSNLTYWWKFDCRKKKTLQLWHSMNKRITFEWCSLCIDFWISAYLKNVLNARKKWSLCWSFGKQLLGLSHGMNFCFYINTILIIT